MSGAQKSNNAAVGGLTERQRQVARLASQTESTAAIADALDITTSTVKSHLTEVYNKLGLSRRVQLVIYAFDHPGCFDLPEKLPDAPFSGELSMEID